MDTDTNFLRMTKTVSDGHILSVTDTDRLRQTQTVCDGHKLAVTKCVRILKLGVLKTKFIDKINSVFVAN